MVDATREDSEPIRWLYDLQHFGIKLGLDNIRALLDLLGHPESAYRSVLVAGTNGKGSVAAMLAALLDAHGLGSGLFTSPHLVRPNERIRIRAHDISTPDLHRQLISMRERIERATDRGVLKTHPSFFEVITATALTSFRESGVDVAVLEVGLGGRLDATNAVDGDLSVVVTVDLDHTKTLGPTLERIAREKAGVIKAGRPVLTGVDQPEALTVLREVCRERGSPLLEVRKMCRVVASRPGTDHEPFGIRTPHGRYGDLVLPLAGRHQRFNAGVAVLALELLLQNLGRRPEPDLVRQGLATVRWRGRLQWIAGDPPLLLDAAHNPAGARALAEFLRRRGGPPPILLFGAMKGKDLEGILGPLAGLVEGVVIARPGVERSLEPDEIAAVAWRLIGRTEVVEQPAAALERASERARPGRCVLVAGSLYLVGQVLGILEREPVPGPVSM